MVFPLIVDGSNARPERATSLVGTPKSGTYVWKEDSVLIPDTTTVSSGTISSAEDTDAGSYGVEISGANKDLTALNSVVLTVAQGIPVTTGTSVSLLSALLALSGLSLSRKP